MIPVRLLRGAVLVPLVLLGGCAVYRPVTGATRDAIASAPVDRELRVTDKRGQRHRLVDVHLEGDSLVGRPFVLNGTRMAIALDDVASLESPASTWDANVLFILGLTAAATLIAAAFVLNALSHVP